MPAAPGLAAVSTLIPSLTLCVCHPPYDMGLVRCPDLYCGVEIWAMRSLTHSHLKLGWTIVAISPIFALVSSFISAGTAYQARDRSCLPRGRVRVQITYVSPCPSLVAFFDLVFAVRLRS